jgi:hypothetical protein
MVEGEPWNARYAFRVNIDVGANHTHHRSGALRVPYTPGYLLQSNACLQAFGALPIGP